MFWGGVTAQTNIKTIDKPKNTEELIIQNLKDLFGEYYNTYVESQPEVIDIYTDYYNRCEYLTADNIPVEIPNISTLIVLDKYNPSVIMHDNISVFKPELFNIFKYSINRYSNEDLYYRIYNTDVVLKINKLQ